MTFLSWVLLRLFPTFANLLFRKCRSAVTPQAHTNRSSEIDQRASRRRRIGRPQSASIPYYFSLLFALRERRACSSATSRPLKKTRPKRGWSASKPVHRVCSEVLPAIAAVGCGATVTAVALCAVDLRCTKKGPRLEGRGPSGLCTSHA